MIEFDLVEVMSDKEASKFKKMLACKKEEKRIEEQHQGPLVDAYFEYLDAIINDRNIQYEDAIFKYDLWKKKKCLCGKNLRFIESYDFYGCPDYRNKNKQHITFSSCYDLVHQNILANIKSRANYTWLAEILKKCGLKSIYTSTELFNFYEGIGLIDLRSIGNQTPSRNLINGIIDTQMRSKQQEKYVEEVFKNFFDRVLSQVCIKYQYKCDIYTKHKIIDLIASDDDDVFVVEIKLNESAINIDQLWFYKDLVNHILTNDRRNIYYLFVTEGNSGYSDSENCKYVGIDSLKTKTTMESFKGHLKSYCI